MDLSSEQQSAVEIKREFTDEFMKQLEVQDCNISFAKILEPVSNIQQFNSIGLMDSPASGLLIEKTHFKINEYYFISSRNVRHILQHSMDYDSSKSFSPECIYCGEMESLEEVNPCYPSEKFSIHVDCYSDLQDDFEKIMEHASEEFLVSEL